MLRLNMAIAGIITLCWIWFTTFPTLLFYSLLFGYSGGSFMSLTQTVCVELFGIDNIATIIGIMFTSFIFGYLLSTPIAGWLYQIQSNYTIPIIISGIFMIIGTIFIEFIVRIKYNNNNHLNIKLYNIIRKETIIDCLDEKSIINIHLNSNKQSNKQSINDYINEIELKNHSKYDLSNSIHSLNHSIHSLNQSIHSLSQSRHSKIIPESDTLTQNSNNSSNNNSEKFMIDIITEESIV